MLATTSAVLGGIVQYQLVEPRAGSGAAGAVSRVLSAVAVGAADVLVSVPVAWPGTVV